MKGKEELPLLLLAKMVLLVLVEVLLGVLG